MSACQLDLLALGGEGGLDRGSGLLKIKQDARKRWILAGMQPEDGQITQLHMHYLVVTE